MPRIRILKNYDSIEISGEQNTGNEWEDGEDNKESRENNETVSSINDISEPKKGWFSSENIISSLTTDKIRASLLYYESQIKLLRQELNIRSIVGRENPDYIRQELPEFKLTDAQSTVRLTVQDIQVKRCLQKAKFLTREQRTLVFEIYLDSKG